VPIPSSRSVLSTLSKGRLAELGRTFAVALSPDAAREAQVELLAVSGAVRLRELLAALGRDERKAACRVHGLDDSGRARSELAARFLAEHGAGETVPPRSLFDPDRAARCTPKAGDIVQVRHRQWLVEGVVPPPEPADATLVKLVCLDDDNQGRRL